MAELFGFKFERTGNTSSEEKFTEPSSEDGTLEVAGGGFYGQLLDTDGRERTEHDLIRRYRDIAQQPECDSAIEDIINEGIVANERDQAVAIILDRIAYPKKIKDRIREEFDTVLELLCVHNSVEYNIDSLISFIRNDTFIYNIFNRTIALWLLCNVTVSTNQVCLGSLSTVCV